MSSWIDRIAVENTLKLRDEFGIKCFIETGTFYGVSAEFYSNFFHIVYTCEKNEKYYNISIQRLCNSVQMVTIEVGRSSYL